MTEINETEKTYELRSLTADDVFPMFNIISKIGIKEIKSCFDKEKVGEILKAVSDEEDKDALTAEVGVGIALELASVVLSNLPKCKEDIYLLLSQLSGMTKKEIAALPLVTFTQMIIDVFRKEEFADFFQLVSKLFR